MFYKNLLSEIGEVVESPIPIYMDNNAAIKTIQNTNENLTEYARHIAIAVHHIRHETEVENIEVKYRNTKDLSADILTKPLGKEDHVRLCNLISGLETNEKRNEIKPDEPK